MPILEAMACGTPVACSNIGSMMEVAGDSSMLFNPESPGDIAGVINEALSNDALRKDLTSRGLKHAEAFRWNSIARQVVATFKELD